MKREYAESSNSESFVLKNPTQRRNDLLVYPEKVGERSCVRPNLIPNLFSQHHKIPHSFLFSVMSTFKCHYFTQSFKIGDVGLILHIAKLV